MREYLTQLLHQKSQMDLMIELEMLLMCWLLRLEMRKMSKLRMDYLTLMLNQKFQRELMFESE